MSEEELIPEQEEKTFEDSSDVDPELLDEAAEVAGVEI